MNLCIDHLDSCGIITNYFCSSACRHCLYACSPRWPKDYIDEPGVVRIAATLKSLNCGSVHIGGGEPFLKPESLAAVLKSLGQAGVEVDYIETNSSWFRDPASAQDLLTHLKSLGLSTLLVSISPFHNEHIPFHKVKGVIRACNLSGIRVFPWIQEFYPDLDRLDNRRPHSMEEFEAVFGAGYVKSILSRYWVHPGGRALSFFKTLTHSQTVDDILAGNPLGCRELSNASHFHLDLFGNYIPGLCSGLSIRASDLGRPLEPARYPFLTVLHRDGIRGLLKAAMKNFGFDPQERYVSKCELCLDIRRHLVLNQKVHSRELQPQGFYQNL